MLEIMVTVSRAMVVRIMMVVSRRVLAVSIIKVDARPGLLSNTMYNTSQNWEALKNIGGQI